MAYLYTVKLKRHTMSEQTIDPRYPIGKYAPQPFSERQLKDWLDDIKNLPALLEQSLNNLEESQLDTPYREGGWSIRRLTHHIADSHMNAYIRFKLALTEDNPTVKPYNEGLWAELKDSDLPVSVSISLVHALHSRFYELLSGMDINDWNRTIFHPVQQKQFTLWQQLGMYAWHGRHHVAHITTAREKRSW